MISVWWFAGCVLVLSIALIRVTIVFDRQRKMLPRPKGQQRVDWRVETSAAAKWERWDDYYGHKQIDSNQCVQVRVVGPGAQVLIAVVGPGADDFEEQINAATAKAEERVIALNALLELTP